MNHSFHGRTMGALAVTGNPHYREAFEPLIGNIKFAELNDFDSVMAQVTDKTCAIIFETVQGEGGIYPATEEFMSKVKALCEEKDILLILMRFSAVWEEPAICMHGSVMALSLIS